MSLKHEIESVLYSYCDAVDRMDLDRFSALFSENAIMDYGYERIFIGRENITELVRSRLMNYTGTSHHLTNISVSEVSTDRATATSTIYAWHQLNDGSQAEVWGQYSNEFTKAPDGWKIDRHQIRAAGSKGFATPDGFSSAFQPITRGPK